jgi:hypothetical protein
MSNAASTQQPESMPHGRAVTEPIPQRKQQAMSADAFIGGLSGRRVVLEVYPETTARDVLQASRSRSELPELASGTNWVVMENFAELGYGEFGCVLPNRAHARTANTRIRALAGCCEGLGSERTVQLFHLQTVEQRDFDLDEGKPRRKDCASQADLKSIPMNAPFLGAYVQYETKKGKWSKRFLETRGGQVFVSKNDKVSRRRPSVMRCVLTSRTRKRCKSIPCSTMCTR